MCVREYVCVGKQHQTQCQLALLAWTACILALILAIFCTINSQPGYRHRLHTHTQATYTYTYTYTYTGYIHIHTAYIHIHRLHTHCTAYIYIHRLHNQSRQWTPLILRGANQQATSSADQLSATSSQPTSSAESEFCWDFRTHMEIRHHNSWI